MTSFEPRGDILHDAPLRRSAEEIQIMVMPFPDAVTTIEELLALPDDGMRHELLDGEHVVTPAPNVPHQRVLARLFKAIDASLTHHAGLEVLWSPADIRLGPRTLVQPDLFVVRKAGPGARWEDVPVPLFAIEVVSPSTAHRDRTRKRRLYLEAGVEEYWVVDAEARLVERWRRGEERPEIAEDAVEWRISGGVSGVVELGELFEGI